MARQQEMKPLRAILPSPLTDILVTEGGMLQQRKKGGEKKRGVSIFGEALPRLKLSQRRVEDDAADTASVRELLSFPPV